MCGLRVSMVIHDGYLPARSVCAGEPENGPDLVSFGPGQPVHSSSRGTLRKLCPLLMGRCRRSGRENAVRQDGLFAKGKIWNRFSSGGALNKFALLSSFKSTGFYIMTRVRLQVKSARLYI